MAKKLDELFQKTGISKTQLALSWPLHDRRITSVIIGVKSESQLRENLVVGDWNLDDEVWEKVNKETALDLGHLSQFAGHAYKTTFGEEET
jgi:aryl-alcohol dehydrogenase-like predicted oxidoreductase